MHVSGKMFAEVTTGAPANAVQAFIDDLRERFSALDDGEPAGCMPELAKANPSDFGIVVATVDGHITYARWVIRASRLQSNQSPSPLSMALR